ncbi:MAG: AsnC family protein [Bacteriovoracia bacterium]
MADRPEQRTNRSKFLYSFTFQSRPYSHKPEKIKKMYLEERMSAREIADELNVSQTHILDRLNRMGIGLKSGKGRMTDPNNYKCPKPPYGWKLRDRKLVPNKAELQICRYVVNRVRQGKNVAEVQREMTQKNFKNRNENSNWDHKAVMNIYKKWKDKL